jgi:hypothetical protein
MSLITARVFDNPIEAHLLKSKLESEGIQSYLFDENIVTINPLYSQLAGGIKLKISDLDTERVQEVLSEYLTSVNEVLQCPNCSSTELYSNFISMKGWLGFLSIVWSVLVMIYPFYYKTKYRCKKCGEEFENN